MAADRTATGRIKRQRELRLDAGWQEVRVWAPSAQRAGELRALASEFRAKAASLDGLAEEISSMKGTLLLEVAEKIKMQGSLAYTTPSGPVLELLTDLARSGALSDFSRAYIVFARARPANARFVAERIPAKIAEGYLITSRRLQPDVVAEWMAQHPDWTSRLKEHLMDPAAFERIVVDIALAIESRSN